MFIIERLSTVKMRVFTKLIKRLNVIPLKILIAFLKMKS